MEKEDFSIKSGYCMFQILQQLFTLLGIRYIYKKDKFIHVILEYHNDTV
jgi:hypothetical protein